jgi:xanthine dehydrogenase accessory factor
MTELLLEALDPERAMAKAEYLRRTAESRHRIVLATVIRTSGDAVKPGDQAMLDDRSILTGFDGLDSASRNIVQRGAREALESGFSVAVRHTLNRHEVDVAYEVVSPIVRLSVCGAGPDAAPLVAAANRLGWHVTLMDHRPALIAAEQWPEVDCILVQSPGEVAGAVAKVDSDAVIVMNHRYERDLEYLAAWIGTPVPYIGVLGPRHRTERMLDALQKKGLDIGSARERIRGPVGLDIGAETSEEIALAIVGEIQAVHAGRGGGFLRSHEGAIHGPLEGSRLEIPEWAPVR